MLALLCLFAGQDPDCSIASERTSAVAREGIGGTCCDGVLHLEGRQESCAVWKVLWCHSESATEGTSADVARDAQCTGGLPLQVSQPVVVSGMVCTMTSAGVLCAREIASGRIVWKQRVGAAGVWTEVVPGPVSSGGFVVVVGQVVRAREGRTALLGLRPADGSVAWHVSLEHPRFRDGPWCCVSAGPDVVLLGGEWGLWAFSSRDGRRLGGWQDEHQCLVEVLGLSGTSACLLSSDERVLPMRQGQHLVDGSGFPPERKRFFLRMVDWSTRRTTWMLQVQSALPALALAPDGQVVMASADSVTVIDALTGRSCWVTPLDPTYGPWFRWVDVAVAADVGLVCIADSSGVVFGVRLKDGRVLWRIDSLRRYPVLRMEGRELLAGWGPERSDATGGYYSAEAMDGALIAVDVLSGRELARQATSGAVSGIATCGQHLVLATHPLSLAVRPIPLCTTATCVLALERLRNDPRQPLQPSWFKD